MAHQIWEQSSYCWAILDHPFLFLTMRETVVQVMLNNVHVFVFTAYRHRLTMPKFYIGSASDEFFLPDDSHYWLNQMLPPMHFLYVSSMLTLGVVLMLYIELTSRRLLCHAYIQPMYHQVVITTKSKTRAFVFKCTGCAGTYSIRQPCPVGTQSA